MYIYMNIYAYIYIYIIEVDVRHTYIEDTDMWMFIYMNEIVYM